MRAFFDGAAKDRDRWRAKNRAYHDEVVRFCRFVVPEGASVLALGCGTGDLLAALKPSRGVGIDLSGEMVRLARRKYPHLTFLKGQAERLPHGERFEWVILSDLVGFLPDVQRVLQEVHRVMEAGSRVVVTHHNPLWEPALKMAEVLGLKMREPVQNWLSRRDIANLLYASGFEVLREENRVLLPFRLPGLARIFNRFVARLPLAWRLGLIQTVVARPMPVARDGSRLSCSVVVPCLNERGTVEAAIRRTPRLGAHTELIFVVGQATDGTAEEVARCIAAYPDRDVRLIRQTGRGKGQAVREGFDAARGDVLMILDGDLTVLPEELPKFFEVLASGRGELVSGGRLVYPMAQGAMRGLNWVGNRFFGLAFSYLIGQRILDTLCGTKALFAADYRRIAAGREALCDFDPFGDFDLLLGAAKLNRKIVEVPVRYRDRVYGTTQIHRFRHGWMLLRMCWVALWKLKFSH